MDRDHPEILTILHNRVPHRIRFRVPSIRHKQTLADLLKHSLLHDDRAKGIYHAEPNIITGTLLVKFHPAFHSDADVVELVRLAARNIVDGKIALSAKHRNPKLGKMLPRAFFTRELLVSVAGNVIAGLLLAAFISR